MGTPESACEFRPYSAERHLSRAAATLTAAGVALLMTAGWVAAHHSFSAQFDASKPISLDGTVVRVEWTNPHVWLFVAVPDSRGEAQIWAVETTSPSALARRGFRPDRAAPGTRLVVRGYRAKDGSRTVRGRDLTLPDGRTLLLATPDTENDPR